MNFNRTLRFASRLSPCAHWSFSASLSIGLLLSSPFAFGRDWYVQSGAPAGAGTERSPFNSLAAAQSMSAIGDTIFVVAAPPSTPALGGGIVLKDRQKLVGKGEDITRKGFDSTSDRAKITHSLGDAVTLANDNEVKNLQIDDPLGGGIMAVNKTGGKLSKLLLTRSSIRSAQLYDQSLCALVTNPSQTAVDYTSSKLVGCGDSPQFFRPSPAISLVERKSAINLLAESVDGDYKLDDISIEDVPLAQFRLWRAGLMLRSAGKAELKAVVNGLSSNRSLRGIMVRAYYQGKVELKMKDVSVQDTLNDGLGVFVGFMCDGLPPTFDLGGFTCQQAFGAPVPLSRAEIVVNLDGYRYRGFQRFGNENNANGIEVGALGGLGTSRIEFHMQNSEITQSAAAGLDLEQVLGYLSPDSIIDLGCVTNDCKQRGYTSKGNNKIYDNGVNAFTGIFGSAAGRQAQLGNMQVQLLLNGGNNNASSNIVYAQNNFWGANPASPITCYSLDWPIRAGALFPTANCIFSIDAFSVTPSYFDARFPILSIDSKGH